MTLENCKRLLEHYKKVGNKEMVEVYAKRVEKKGGKPLPTPPKKEVKNAKKPKGE